MITENGWSDRGELDDYGRIKCLRSHLEVVLDMALNNESNLIGYSGWHKESYL